MGVHRRTLARVAIAVGIVAGIGALAYMARQRSRENSLITREEVMLVFFDPDLPLTEENVANIRRACDTVAWKYKVLAIDNRGVCGHGDSRGRD